MSTKTDRDGVFWRQREFMQGIDVTSVTMLFDTLGYMYS